jgi:hypothetical protein
MQRYPPRCEQQNVREILKREIYSQDIPKANPNAVAYQSNAPPPPPYMPIKDFTFYFDSLFKSGGSDPAVGQLTYSISNLNALSPIQNIVECRVGSFYFPNILSTTAADFFYFRRVYLQIGNVVRTSSAQGNSGNTYHFEFEVTNVNSTSVLLEPVNEAYYFQVPQTSVSDIQFTFYAPLNFRPIPLPADQLTVQTVPGSNPGQFIILTGDTTAIAPIGVPTPPGIAVFFNNFISDNLVINNVVNSPNGIFVTNVISLTNIATNVSFASVTTANISTMNIGKNRIAFQMRFTCLDTSPKNGAIQTHI